MKYCFLSLLIPLLLAAQTSTETLGGNFPTTNVAIEDLVTVEGRVFNALTGIPLRKATVSFTRPNSGTVPAGGRSNYSTVTDVSGHFSITGIAPGIYNVSARHVGFLSMQYNAVRPGGPGTNLALVRAQKLTGLDFRLTPHSVVSGRITDEDGDPIEGVQIQLLRLVYSQGKKQLQQNGGALTNDLGEYRMPGVNPGKYYICAIYRSRRAASRGVDDASPQDEYATSYFPGSTDISSAAPIDIISGDQVEGINIRMTKSRAVRISGRVVDNVVSAVLSSNLDTSEVRTIPQVQGKVARPGDQNSNVRIQLRLQPRSSLGLNGIAQSALVKIDGTFEFQDVTPGAYYLIAAAIGRGTAHTTRQLLDVGSTNIDGVTVSINHGVAVSGSVHYDGEAPQPSPSISIRLLPREPNMGMPLPQPAKVDPNGSFHFDDVNVETYTVVVSAPPNVYPKWIHGGSADIIVSGLDLATSAQPIDILLGTNPPIVAGSVISAATGQPAAAITVVLMPREKERRSEPYFYLVTNTDQSGNFSFSAPVQGDYEVYAWDDVQYGQWFDPDFMKLYEGKGESLTAKEGSPVSVKLIAIAAK